MTERSDLPRSIIDLVPTSLIAQHPAGSDGVDWLRRVPHLIDRALERWDLTVTGRARHRGTALVVPTDGPGGPCDLSLSPTPIEHRAFTLWAGDGAPRLHAADPAQGVLLLNALTERHLGHPSVSGLDAWEEIGRLARVLDRPAQPWARERASAALQALIDDIDDLVGTRSARAHALPRRLLERGRGLARELLTDPHVDARLVPAGLAPEQVWWREDDRRWVCVEPCVVVADPTWVVAPTLLSRWADAGAAYDLRTHLQLRLDLVCEAAGLDPERARVVSELRILSDAVGHVIDPTDLRADTLTPHVTVIKALQPA